jgi:hypothetical protein
VCPSTRDDQPSGWLHITFWNQFVSDTSLCFALRLARGWHLVEAGFPRV